MELETSFPKLDIWNRVDEQIKRTEESRKKHRRANRDEIRRKLASDALEDEHDNNNDSLYRKPNSVYSRLQHGTNLQICFMNESYSDPGRDPVTPTGISNGQQGVPPGPAPESSTEASKTTSVPPQKPARTFEENFGASCENTLIPDEEGNTNMDDEDFISKQARLQQEARLALAQAKPMAEMQLKIERLERQNNLNSYVTEMIGIPGFIGGKWQVLSRSLLVGMNVAQLQVLVNELHTHIQNFNDELMRALIDRDDLHTTQDSMLVDIEDLTKRAQEYTQQINDSVNKP